MPKKRSVSMRELERETKRFEEPATEKEKAIIDAAVALMGERGVDGATTAEIARRAGVTEKTLFRYFPSKRDLVRRVISAGSTNVRAFGEDFQRKPEMDPVEFKSILKAHGRPMLYCLTARFMSQGSPAQISDKTRAVIARIGAGGGVTLYGAMVPQETPSENVRAFVAAARQFGRYPVSI